MADDLTSILDVKLRCPICKLVVKVGEAIPDIDGEGSLGCPKCLYVRKSKILLEEKK